MADEPEIQPQIGPVQQRVRTWVQVRHGRVHAVKHTHDWFKHPFEDLEDADYVVDGTGVEVAPGHFVDAKGNFTPAEGRTAPIPQGLPAYHAGPDAGGTAVAGAGAGNAPAAAPNLAFVEPRNKDQAQHDAGTLPVHATNVPAKDVPASVATAAMAHDETSNDAEPAAEQPSSDDHHHHGE